MLKSPESKMDPIKVTVTRLRISRHYLSITVTLTSLNLLRRSASTTLSELIFARINFRGNCIF